MLPPAGPEEEGGRVKTKPVSSSTGVGGGKRPATDSPPDLDPEPSDRPAPPKVTKKIGFGLISPPVKKPGAISIKLGASKPKEPAPTLLAKKPVASIFDEDDDDSEPEEMPAEAKMRMKNVGRETPTSAGPNSFNKGKQGFSDHQKLWERKLKTHSDQS